MEPLDPHTFNAHELGENVAAVICGIDFSISYRKYCKAHTYLKNKECHYIVTNTDSTFPITNTDIPGSGSICSVLSVSTGRKPIVVGKPNERLMEAIKYKNNINLEMTCFVGDRLDTDIQFAHNSKMRGNLLVLTGVSQLKDFETSTILPQYYCSHLGSIYENYQHEDSNPSIPFGL